MLRPERQGMGLAGLGNWVIRQMPERKRRHRFYLWLALAFAVAVLAWAFSALPPSASSEQSGWLRGLVESILGVTVSELLIRKLAHFTEYLLMGLFAGAALRKLGFRPGRALIALALMLLAALIDETIQVFSGRGPSVVDVWIDLAGAAVGLIVVKLTKRALTE